jgi:ADP-ribose pyrophosphatase YjhB (NUDIX family)
MMPQDLQKPNSFPKDCKVHKLVADVFVLSEGKVLLVRYHDISKYDGQKGWFLPDDYLAFSEHPLDATRRLLREQVGLNVDQIALSYIESPGGEQGGAWHPIFHHKVELTKNPTLILSTNIRSAEWFGLSSLPERSSMAHAGWALDVIAAILQST